MRESIRTTKTDRRNGYDFSRDGGVTWVGDSGHLGTDVYYSARAQRWVFIDYENKGKAPKFVESIAAVFLPSTDIDGDPEDAYPNSARDYYLNQTALAGDWGEQGVLAIVDSADVEALREHYGDEIEVIFVEPDPIP